MLEIVTKASGSTSKIDFRCYNHNYRGLVATQKIKQDDILI